MNQLPPFPVDDATLDMLMAAINPREHGDPFAESSSVQNFLAFMSELGGSDTRSVEEDGSTGRRVVGPLYHENSVMESLALEVKRLRAAALVAVEDGRRLEREAHAPDHKAEIAGVVREIVGLATDPNGPSREWIQLVRAVADGEYTPPRAWRQDDPEPCARHTTPPVNAVVEANGVVRRRIDEEVDLWRDPSGDVVMWDDLIFPVREYRNG